VFAGGALSGAVAPTATLLVPGAAPWDGLGSAGLRVGDVTGDGQLDLVAGAHRVDTSSAVDAGAVYVWPGGPGLSGTSAPGATLSVPGAAPQDFLGQAGWAAPGLHLRDVSGDGTLDVVAGASAADVTAMDDGAVYVWWGGAGLTGSLPPTATLLSSTPSPGDRLAEAGQGQGILFEDLNQDGWLDLVVVASSADVGGVQDVGALYLWLGGPLLTGTPAQTARRWVPGAAASDRLGSGTTWPVQLVDVNGDGMPDQVALASNATVGGVQGAGALYVWFTGGGSNTPSATLTAPNPGQWDQLGGDYFGQGVQLADVSGDGLADAVVTCSRADVGGAVDAGAVFVWTGGPGLTGAPAPTATLSDPVPTANELLGTTFSGWGTLLADLTGEGVLDLIVGAEYADVGAAVDCGAIFTWKGGAGLAGSPAPWRAHTVPGALPNDNLGSAYPGQPIVVGDATGYGRPDLIGVASYADVGGVLDAGSLHLWSGFRAAAGALAPPTASFTVPGAAQYDNLGS
jgi:hypothetical protein